MKTLVPAQLKGNERKWYVIDAKWQNLWRLSTKIATLLKGKNKVDFVPFFDNGDYVIVLNCDQFAVSGNKMEDKMYYTHSGYLGGIKSSNLVKLLVKRPAKPLEHAISGMLPKNKLKSDMFARLKLFTWSEHTFVAQQPEVITL